MALDEINKDAISFKRLSGKAHTNFAFAVTEEGLTSNVQIAYTTVFGSPINPIPATDTSGAPYPLTDLGDTDGSVQKVRFEIDVITDTEIGTNQSQGWRLKLPSAITIGGVEYPAGTYLYEALGKLQIVSPLYGTLKGNGTTDYDPVLLDTNQNVIPTFSSIDWNLDFYSGVLFVEEPPTGFNNSAGRPAFLEAFLFVGDYLDVTLQNAGGGAFTAGAGIDNDALTNDQEIALDLRDYNAPTGLSITYTGTSEFIVNDEGLGYGIQYQANYATTFQDRSLVDKAYVDAIASGLSVLQPVDYASTGNTNTGATTTIDGQTLVDGNRVLLKDQTDATENGIYVYSGGSLTRAEDFDEGDNVEIISGAFTSVLSGNTNAQSIFVVATPDPITLGITDIIFVRLALPLVYTAGIGIDKNGNEFSIDGDFLANTGLSFDTLTGFDVTFTATTVGNGISVIDAMTQGESVDLRSITGDGGITVSLSGQTIVIDGGGVTGGGASGILGVPDDGTYNDGLFPFESGTTVGNAVDDINEFLLSLAPPFAPDLDNIGIDESPFAIGKLSFGSTKNDVSPTYINSGTVAGTSAIDINEVYDKTSTKIGITNSAINGFILNDSVTGNENGAGIPYVDNAFGKGNEGSIVLELNGSTLSTIDLESTTSAIANSYISVSAVQFSKFSTGSEFSGAPYRTGSFSIPTTVGNMRLGWNYARIIHSGTSAGDIETNYLEWIYDADGNAIQGSAAAIPLGNISLSGSKFISGVEYFESGTVEYQITIANAYRNVYSNASDAITFVNRANLGDVTTFGMDISGLGIVNQISQVTKTLPPLDINTSNPEITDISIAATLGITKNNLIGTTSRGTASTAIRVKHPFDSQKGFTSSITSVNDFLIYNVSDSSSENSENFSGENRRMQDLDYINNFDYDDLSSGNGNWNSTQNIFTSNAGHSSGMLVLDGALYYPNSSKINNLYGIPNGNFANVQNAPAGGVNYENVAGEKEYYRIFKSNNTSTQSTLTFNIGITGAVSFLTDIETAGTPTGNQVKLEFLVRRATGDGTVGANNSDFGWSNPFSPTTDTFGIARTSLSNGGTTVTCTLSQKRVNVDDIVIVRMKFAQNFSESITSLGIANI